jgi:hypothetical protein
MRNLILLSPILSLLLAICFARLVYRRSGSVVLSSTVFTLFFSFGISINRIATPVPTLVFIPMAFYDLINAPTCMPTSEGCYPDAEPGTALTLFLFLFLIQWAFWTSLFGLFQFLSTAKKR